MFILFVVITTNVYSQTKNEMLAELNGNWNLDDNGNVTISKIVDSLNLKKDEIFNRVLNYFTYNYGSGKSVIQTQDKETGLIVAKGLYDNVHIGISLITTYIDTWHIIRVDVKDGKARIIITLTNYEKKVVSSGNNPPTYTTTSVSNEFPINPKGYSETVMTKAFYKSYKKAKASLEAIEKSIKEGNTSKTIEQNSW